MSTELTDAQRSLVAQRFRRREAAAAPTVPRLPEGARRPLSYAQERLWFMEQAMSGGTSAYTISLLLNLRGPLDAGLLRRALAGVAARHESLRTRIAMTDDGEPLLRIADDPEVPFTEIDVSGSADPEAEVDRAVTAAADRPFAIADEPMLRALLVREDADRHVLLVSVHHAVMDGWSTSLFVRELSALYAALAAGRAAGLPPLAVQYGDYAAWQRDRLTGAQLARDLDHWRDALAGIPPLDLPTDRPRPHRQTFAGAGHHFRIGKDVVDGLTALGAAHGATPYMTLMALYQVLLHRWSGQQDFAVGSPVAGRVRPELEPLIGMFANVLTMRARITGTGSFLDVLAATRQTVLAAMAHQEVPFEKIVADLGVTRDLGRPPLFQATFALQNYADSSGERDAGPVSVSWRSTVPRTTRFDLEWYAFETGDGLECLLVHNTDLFSAQTADRFARHLETLARAVLAAPELPVRELELLAADERESVVRTWSDGPVRPVPAVTLDALVAAQVARTPEAVAVTDGRRTLTYRELDAAAEELAAVLRARGAGPGSVVGVCLPRCVEVSVALLAVLKAGAAFLPLDPEHPAERTEFMLGDAGAELVVTHRGLLPDSSAAQAVYPDEAVRRPGADGQVAAAAQVRPDDAAYLIYTSGSTGRPKGVVNTHRGIVNRLDWMQREFALGADDVVLQKTSPGFDVSVWEFFWPLVAGARLVFAEPGGHRDPAYLCELIRRAGVTTVHFVPSMLTAFLAEDAASACTSLRRVLCSGEALPALTARDTVAALPHARLANLYGPTEAAIDVTAWECRPAGLPGLGRIPIGSPIQNLRTYVLDATGSPAPVGVPGELYLGGAGLARGYHGRPGLTAQRFVPDPYGPAGGRLYRTGDLACWRSDGTLDILGRLDQQVKLRGQRIELGEIEAALRAEPGVRAAAAALREDTPGDQRIAAYVVTDDGAGTAPDRLREALRRTLPDAMVPSSVTVLDALPLLASGKLDRSALPVPAPARPAASDADAGHSTPQTDSERLVAAVWHDVLGAELIGLDDDFFDLGGHSLLAIQVVARLRKASGSGVVGVLDLFTQRTVRALAALLDRPAEAAGRSLLAELTPRAPGLTPAVTYVCVPYGGGSAVVYQPLADALPAGHRLLSVAIPGHDVGLDDDALPFEELARRCADEILAGVSGPLVLYGHSGLGAALTVAVARLLHAADRPLTAVYIGAVFPFARPRGLWSAVKGMEKLERLRSNRVHANWLTSMGITLDDIDAEQADRIIGAMRDGERSAEAYFTALLDEPDVTPLDAPVITVVGERDPVTKFYQERFREWEFLSPVNAVVTLEEAGHYFLRYRAAELAEILTTTHAAIAGGTADTLTADGRGAGASWSLTGVTEPKGIDEPVGEVAAAPGKAPVPAASVQPGMRRFLAVAGGQVVSMLGSALTQWALPLYIYLHTGSLGQYALLSVTSLIPGLLIAPVAGAIVDRCDRRKVMLGGDAASAVALLCLGLLLWTGRFHIWEVYPIIVAMAVSTTFQRLAYSSAVAQLVPKRFLGHAIGLNQFASGTAQLMVPLIAVGLLAAIGLGGMVALDVASYAVAVAVTAAVRFPATMAWERPEGLVAEIKHGLAYSWRLRGLRGMLLFFAAVNVFLAVPLMVMAPMVLAFGTVGDVGRMSFVGALGAVLGAGALSVWGGPRRHRMRGVLIASGTLGLSAVVAGLHADLPLIAVGVFGTTLSLTLLNGIYTMIIQVKTPQRFHGRVFALNQMLAWSTLPIGFGLLGPFAVRHFEPLMAHGGALAGTAGAVLGTGPGRGIALADVVAGLIVVTVAVIGALAPTLARFDEDMPDAMPDDLIGAQEVQRAAGAGDADVDGDGDGTGSDTAAAADDAADLAGQR